MSKLCDKLCPYITIQHSHLRKPKDVEKQIAIVLHYQADEERMGKVLTALEWVIVVPSIVRRVNKAISENLASKYHAASMEIHNFAKNIKKLEIWFQTIIKLMDLSRCSGRDICGNKET